MLYDTRWDAKVQADPLTLAAFIAWLETQPADQEYNFLNCFGACLLGQYMASVGLSDYDKTALAIFGPWGNDSEFPNQTVLSAEPHTFGAALQRAREFAARRGV